MANSSAMISNALTTESDAAVSGGGDSYLFSCAWTLRAGEEGVNRPVKSDG